MEVADYIAGSMEVGKYNLVVDETAAAKMNVFSVIYEKMGMLLLPDEADNSTVVVVDRKVNSTDSHNYFDYSF